MIRINANENYYGCSPKVKKTLLKNIANIHHYPSSGSNLEIRLSEIFNCNQQNIVLGAGSVKLIEAIIQFLVNVDDEILFHKQSFVAYEQLALMYKRNYKLVPLVKFKCDVDNMLLEVSPKTKLIFIANPNNPTGTIISHAELKRLLSKVPPNCFVVIDEAYAEYVNAKNFPNSIKLQKTFPNLIILRTFSKIYGLAGLRIGYAIVNNEVANVLRKNRLPFYLNTFCEDAAITAISDKKFIEKSCIKNNLERIYLRSGIKSLGFQVLPSEANFLYLPFKEEKLKDRVYEFLIKNNIQICDLKVFGQSNALRITIADRKINTHILQLLKQI